MMEGREKDAHKDGTSGIDKCPLCGMRVIDMEHERLGYHLPFCPGDDE